MSEVKELNVTDVRQGDLGPLPMGTAIACRQQDAGSLTGLSALGGDPANPCRQETHTAAGGAFGQSNEGPALASVATSPGSSPVTDCPTDLAADLQDGMKVGIILFGSGRLICGCDSRSSAENHRKTEKLQRRTPATPCCSGGTLVHQRNSGEVGSRRRHHCRRLAQGCCSLRSISIGPSQWAGPRMARKTSVSWPAFQVPCGTSAGI